MEILRYILTNLGLTMANEKVKIIREWPEPQKIKDIHSFLGFTNFYRRSIHNYLEITVLLTQLTQKGTTWNFNPECRSAFKLFKKTFTSTLILTHWIPDQPLVVETDTLDYTLAAILSMYNPDSELHPIAFHSQTFSSAELLGICYIYTDRIHWHRIKSKKSLSYQK